MTDFNTGGGGGYTLGSELTQRFLLWERIPKNIGTDNAELKVMWSLDPCLQQWLKNVLREHVYEKRLPANPWAFCNGTPTTARSAYLI